MKLLVVVSEFPKITETFAVVHVLHYLSKGHDVGVFHLKPFRHNEIVHDEARPVVERGFTFPWIAGASMTATLEAIVRRPAALAYVLRLIVRAMWREPQRLAATLAIVPKSLALGRYADRQDVTHIHAEFASHPATAAWIASTVFGTPFSFSAHMYDIFVSQSLLAEKSKRALFVRAISEFNRDFLSKVEGFDADKIEVIRCGVSAARFPPRPLEPAPDGSREILYVGSLVPRKGVDVLLAALAKLKDRTDWRLTVLGGGSEESRLKRIAADDLPGRVRFCGPASMAEVKEAMYSADLLVVSSVTDRLNRSEGIPVVSMEALAAELPVIAPRLSGIPELIEDGVTGYLFSPGDPSDLAAKIGHVMSHPEEARCIARRGRKRVLEDYNVAENAEELLKLFEKHGP